jgi:DNA-directed RNA polymerase specialized sigma24 family protein
MRFARLARLWAAFVGLTLAIGAGGGAAEAQIGSQTVTLLDRLCAQTLRTNEEDRLYGMISLAVRATIRYRGAEFRPDVIDDAVQDSLDSMIEDCPELTEAEASKRVTMAIEMISDATTKVLADAKAAEKSGDKDSQYPKRPPEKLTAADLSEELSSQEIDQWLNSLPPRQRALSLFLYASDVTPKEIAEAVGEPPGTLTRQFAASKADLLRIFHEEWQEPGSRAAPAMTYRESGGEGAAALIKGAATTPASAPATSSDDDLATAPPAPAPPRATADGVLPGLRVTGISDDLYAGWSLIATGRNLPRGQRISINQPFLLEPDTAGMKRMLVTDIAEIGNPNVEPRHFLLKAYAIDASAEAAGLRDSFHVGAIVDNDEAKKTLANPDLSSIEVARCLWHDYGTAPDPGLCRPETTP